jgi:hypothetical protein
MADNANPFGALVTPEVLSAQRRAQFDQEYQGQNPWVKLAAEAGFNMREMDRARGIGLTAEDRKAQRNQQIMKQSQSQYEQALKAGKTADEAQADVLEAAIREFAKNGEWEQALAMTQPLNALKEQALERRKLKAEAENIESKPEAKALDQELAAIKAQQAYDAKLQQLEVARQNAQTAQDRLDVQMAIAELQNQRALDKLEAKANAPEKESVAQWKARKETNESLAAASDSANLMADLRTMIKRSPGALSMTGEFATRLGTYSTSAKALLNRSGWDPDELKGGGKASEWVKLNVDNASQRALVVQLAYAFARANDPGGRLSNQDLEQAKAVVSGEGNPEARLAVLDGAFSGLARSTTSKLGAALDMDTKIGDNSRNRWIESARRYGTLARGDQKPEAPAAAADGGWVQAAPGVRIREVK